MSNYVYYRNPRTGQAYSIGGTYRNGYRSYQGGFSYSTPNRYYANYSGWGGGPGTDVTGVAASTERQTTVMANVGAGESEE